MAFFDPSSVPLTGSASVFQVVRYDREAEGDDRFTVLPNVLVGEIHFVEGPIPASASFSYVFDSADPSSPYPSQWEQVWPTNAAGRYIVKADDELIVYEYTGGNRILVFDGFVAIPQTNQGQGLIASFTATSVHQRLWDQPVQGAVYRDSSDILVTTKGSSTGLPVRFNPHGQPNRTPDGYDVDNGESTACPIFLDANTAKESSPTTPEFWTLGGFIRYLFINHNMETDPNGDLWVRDPVSPNGITIDDYLKAATPKSGDFMTLSDASSYTLEDIVIRDYDASNRPLPIVAAEQLAYYGYRIFLNTREDPDDPGAPINEIVIFRVDGRDGNAPKEVFCPKHGASLTGGLPDFDHCGLSRDHVNAFNEVMIETKEVGYEGGFVLAPGFTITAGDETTPRTWDKAALTAPDTTAEDRRKYRVFVFDEAGAGHWDFTDSEFVTELPTALDDVLGHPDEETDTPAYIFRPRPARGNTLFSLDDSEAPRKACLEISRDYAGPSPSVWDGTGTWQSIADSGWKFTADGLGIELTGMSNPEGWKITTGTGAATAGNVVQVITSLANPSGTNTRFYLKLTCVIDGDYGMDIVATRRLASPMRFTVRSVIEAKDHWQKQVVCKSSRYNTTKAEKIVRDDTDAAQAHADSLRLAHEFPGVGGSINIPWITHAYGVGDFISSISGRNIDLDGGAGGAAGEGPRYPTVIGFTYQCQNPQGTTLKLDDRRSEPEKANHGRGKKRRA